MIGCQSSRKLGSPETSTRMTAPKAAALPADAMKAVTGDGATCDVSVRFDALAPTDRSTLRALMEAQGIVLSTEPLATGSTRDKRVVLGRAVSGDALHLEHDPELRVGDDCRVALYAGTGEGPLHVRGCITEAEPDRGLRLRLEAVSG